MKDAPSGKIKKPIRRTAFWIVFGCGVLLLVTTITISLGAAICMVFRDYKRDAEHEASFAISLLSMDYMSDLYSRTEEIYASVPEDIGKDAFSDEYRAYFSPLVDDEYDKARSILIRCRECTALDNICIIFYDDVRDRQVYLLDGDTPENAYIPGQYVDDNNGSCDDIKRIRAVADSDWFMSILYGRVSGWTATDYVTMDLNGREVFVVVDFSIDDLFSQLLIFLVYSIPLTVIVIWFVSNRMGMALENNVTAPLQKLSAAADRYMSYDKADMEDIPRCFEGLDISTGNEIEGLYHTMIDMEKNVADTMEQIRTFTAAQEMIKGELHAAARIQASQLPRVFPAFPDREDFDIYASMIPARDVGGDFYDFFLIDDDHLALLIADVSGKGIPASLFMMSSKLMIKSRLMSGDGPARALEMANAELCATNDTCMFVTVWLAVAELSTGKLTYVDAGHGSPAVRRGGGDYALLKDGAHFLLLGVMPDAGYEETVLSLGRGDSLLLFTDGVNEASKDEEHFFGYENLLATLNRDPQAPPQRMIESVKTALDDFVEGAEQFDDITMLAFRLN